MTHVSDGRLLNPTYQPHPHQPHPRQPEHDRYDEQYEYETNSLENEPLDFDEIPGTSTFQMQPLPPRSPDYYTNGLPTSYVNPRAPMYSSSPVTRPPPLGPEVSPGSRWAPPTRSPGAGLVPPGLPDFTNFDGELDSLKYETTNRSDSRNQGRGSVQGVHPPPPPIIVTPADPSSGPSTQRTSNSSLEPQPTSDRSPSTNHMPIPGSGIASRLSASFSGLTGGLGFSRPSFMRSPGSVPVPPPVPEQAPVADPVPRLAVPSASSRPAAPSRSPAPPSQVPSQAPTRAPSGAGTRPEINRVRNTLGPTHQVPMAPIGSPQRPPVVASKPPPQQPKGFPLTRPNTRFTDRNKNKTRAQVEAFQALRDEQDLERQRQWDVSHGSTGYGLGDTSMEQSRPPSPQGSVRSRKSRAVTVVSTSDEDDWTTGRSLKGRPL